MFRSLNFRKFITHVLYLVALSIIVSQRSTKTYTVQKIVRYKPDLKHILVWTNMHGIDDEGQIPFIKRKCVNFNCYITKNRSLFSDVRYFDAILFNVQEISQMDSEVPRSRGVMQKYIFVANDSAENYPVCTPLYDKFFNWSWTYRPDSTIPYRFITVKNLQDEELGSHFQWNRNMSPIDILLKNQLYSKSKAAVIFLDKCESKSKREDFIRVLEKHLREYKLDIDVFGNCGPRICKRKTMAPCYWKLRKNYYFYLAMEDSIAVDYITDTVLNGYKYNAVPIVLGGAEYQYYLPPNSYLNALELGPKKLAKTMHEIIQNRSRYFDFFRWRNYYTLTESRVLNPCTLCTTLNNQAWMLHRITYVNFRKWWNPRYKDSCDSSRKALRF